MKKTYLPNPKVPLSRVVSVNGMLYLSGDASINHETGMTVDGDIRQQTERTISNLRSTLEKVGSSLEKVVKTTVFMTDMSQFGEMNDVYREFFPSDPPARSTVGVAALARKELLVEIELIALP